MKITKINAFSRKGIPNGDNCEKCETEEKPIYRIKNYDFGIDIILCPKCLDELKEKINSINL